MTNDPKLCVKVRPTIRFYAFFFTSQWLKLLLKGTKALIFFCRSKIEVPRDIIDYYSRFSNAKRYVDWRWVSKIKHIIRYKLSTMLFNSCRGCAYEDIDYQ